MGASVETSVCYTIVFFCVVRKISLKEIALFNNHINIITMDCFSIYKGFDFGGRSAFLV